ncbi:MAG: hypothetical protein SNJ67_03340 [Chloracidobacterium sp.]|uniref:Uncharacterized protein n=1 Tax=Chloracidobacterium validum TaxID=2821543 RepID=A0ABX8B9Q6_9BACT|nr:hypothetical protein [Chloracidobacterium validum]QUW02285.1 hypothetical protein J8C06_07920 [Chloracidobacterium validum]
MTSPSALSIRIYVTDWGDVRIETPHWRQTLPPSEFVRRLYAAVPTRRPPTGGSHPWEGATSPVARNQIQPLGQAQSRSSRKDSVATVIPARLTH